MKISKEKKQRLLENFQEILNNQNKFHKNIEKHVRNNYPDYHKRGVDLDL
jgi:vacuolar-type H+-ATPase subunit D/Vma8